MRRNLLVIGLDSAEQSLLRRWARDGDLPAIAGMMKHGASGEIGDSSLFSAGLWPTFYTGLRPNRHGRYFYDEIVPGTYETRILPHGELLEGEPFWESAARAGRRAAVVDIPKSRVSHGLNGIQLVDWANHDPDIITPARSWPPGLAAEADARFGEDPLDSNDFGGRGPGDVAMFRDHLIRNVERKTDFLLELVSSSEWDLVVSAFDDAHQIGHLCWHLHDPSHPRHDPEAAARVGDPLKEVYRALDRAVGRLAAAVPADTRVMVLASHGMGPRYHWNDKLDDVLRAMEGIVSMRGGLYRALKALWDAQPLSVQRPLFRVRARLREALLGPDRGRRKCFAIPTSDELGGVRINLKGREPRGIVEAGAEFDELCREIEATLMELRDVESGRSLVSRVIRVTDIYTGGHLDCLPDLLVQWDAGQPVFEARSDRLGTFSKTYTDTRSGSHRGTGMFVMTGPEIMAGSRCPATSLVDFAPTIAAMLDIPLPDVDGNPIACVSV